MKAPVLEHFRRISILTRNIGWRCNGKRRWVDRKAAVVAKRNSFRRRLAEPQPADVVKYLQDEIRVLKNSW